MIGGRLCCGFEEIFGAGGCGEEFGFGFDAQGFGGWTGGLFLHDAAVVIAAAGEAGGVANEFRAMGEGPEEQIPIGPALLVDDAQAIDGAGEGAEIGGGEGCAIMGRWNSRRNVLMRSWQGFAEKMFSSSQK